MSEQTADSQGSSGDRVVGSTLWVWTPLTVLIIAATAYTRLRMSPEAILVMPYGLPLLICLLHRRVSLLYVMAAAFTGIVILTLGILNPSATGPHASQVMAGGMRLGEIWLSTAGVHGLIVASRRQRQSSAALEASNEQLRQHDEELQVKTEELESQTEELRQQSQELELQSAELDALNHELSRRAKAQQTILECVRSLRSDMDEAVVMAELSRATVQVMGEQVVAAAFVRQEEARLVLRGQYGFSPDRTASSSAPYSSSFAALIIGRGQTGYIRDLADRPDLQIVQPSSGRPFRSIIASPICIEGKVVWAVEAFAYEPRDWTEDDFRIIEWMAAEAALTFEAIERRRDLIRRRDAAELESVQKTRFLAAVSHDVRTPANAISLLADLVEQSASNPAKVADLQQTVRDLKANAHSLVELVSDVLDLTRSDTDRLQLQLSHFRLAEMLEKEVRQHLPLAQSKGLPIHLELPEQEIVLHTDKIKLVRVISNLLGNAAKFTESGAITVSARLEPDGSVTVAIADTGVGIPQEVLPRIFDEFFQLRNPERDRSKGNGLGLAICKRLADTLGCTVSVQSTVGKGSTFSVHISSGLVVASRPQATAPSDAASKSDAPRQPLKGLQILLVEDHDWTRRATSQLLTARGAKVFSAPNGRTGLDMLAHESPDVLLLDLMLPDMDGTAILEHLRANRPASLRCVFAVSGDVREERIAEVRRLGADDMVPKPVKIDSLIAAILRRTKGQVVSVVDS